MKGPPTEEDLLQIGKSISLQKITYLDLSRQNLGTVDPEIFNKLESIQTIDLSQNCLTQISEDLRIPSLHTLDLSDNQLESINFVKNLGRLEQLYLEDNDAITMDDYYIAKVLCPSLRSIDGAEDVKHIEKGIQLYTSQLEPQIEAVWEARFSEVYGRGVSQDEMKNLHDEFVRTINQGNVVGSNLTMPKFRDFMIRHLCWKLIEEVNRGLKKSKRRSVKSSDGTNTPSQYGTRVSKGVTPVKHYSTGIPVADSEQKDTPGQSNKKKRKREITPDNSPKFQSAKKKREVTPDKSQVKAHSSKRKREDTSNKSPIQATSAAWKQDYRRQSSPVQSPAAKRAKNDTKTPEFTKIRHAEGTEIAHLKKLPDYEPFLFLRCHSQDNNPADHTTKVWNCAFEPLIGSPGETSNILATCGGHNICFIDCQTGKVMKRYKDSSKSESFYALAWTTLEADEKNLKEDVNILAVGGQDGVIKLIHPTQLVMFGTLKGHKGYVSSLVFHPTRRNILFSGSKDGRIIMWEIETPDFKDYSIKWSQKAVFTLPKTDTICLAVNSELEVLIAGCEESCYGWKLQKLYKNEKNINVGPDFEFVHPRVDEEDEPVVVDGLALLSNNCIVSKCVDQNRLYLWDLEPHTEGGFKGPKPYRILVSPLAELQYIHTAVDYIYLNSSKDVLSVGDDKGNIYMYKLKSVVRKKKTSDELLQPSLKLEYPDTNIDTNYEETMQDVSNKKDVVINCIGQSSGREFVVCGTDNNLICIWKASSC